MNAKIRLATPDDAPDVQPIYAPIVRETAISFEAEPPTVEEMQQRIMETLEHMPWLVCGRRRDILGYVYASKHRTRPAYQWSVDVSVYVHTNPRRAGVGHGPISLALRAPCLAGLL
jgi:L-amino acid N-acyltransferase YncA